LLAVYPLAALLGAAFSDDLPLLAMTFLSTTGFRADDVVAVQVLPGGPPGQRVPGSGAPRRRREVCRHAPAEAPGRAVREYLGADVPVIDTELRVVGRRFSGTVVSPDVAAGVDRSLGALVAVLGRDRIIDVGLCTFGAAGDRKPAFLQVCQERRVVSTPEKAPATPLPRSEYPKLLVFHDGHLVWMPDPRACLAILLWLSLYVGAGREDVVEAAGARGRWAGEGRGRDASELLHHGVEVGGVGGEHHGGSAARRPRPLPRPPRPCGWLGRRRHGHLFSRTGGCRAAMAGQRRRRCRAASAGRWEGRRRRAPVGQRRRAKLLEAVDNDGSSAGGAARRAERRSQLPRRTPC
ncbi:hypothetical protein BAE44_0016924, partial [Dichanthelium oligosanthes]